MQLRGQLILLFEEPLFDPSSGLMAEDIYREPVDGSLFIARGTGGLQDAVLLEKIRTEAYWSVLRLCMRLGMISGRGVPKAACKIAEHYMYNKHNEANDYADFVRSA
jgi:hypothetical protein